MSGLQYNQICGWKSHPVRKKVSSKSHQGSFILSLITALVLVLIVAQVLAAIDRRIQNQNYKEFSANFKSLIALPTAQAYHSPLDGRILLQVEEHGEAWYVNPLNSQRYYLGRPADAFRVMKNLALGISNQDFESFNGYAPYHLRGRILLKVEDKGKAYYVHPKTLKMYFLGRPADAFAVMRQQGLGVSNKDLATIKVASGYAVSDVASTSVPQEKITRKSLGIFSQGIDVKEYCKSKNYKISVTNKNELDKECEKMEAERVAKVATYAEQNTIPVTNTQVTLNDNSDSQPISNNSSNTSFADLSNSGSTSRATNVPIISGEGPLIRVGVFHSTQPQMIKATHTFYLQDSSGNVLMTIVPNQILMIDYLESSNKYGYGLGQVNLMTSSYLRLVPTDSQGVFEVVSYENRPAWNPSLNDNKFLGVLELRHNFSKNRTWLINELPMESYLKGIAETSNSSPMEYQKAMMIAARTYASYHLQRGTKHGDEYFTVDATYDQVYKGYGTQQRLTKVSQAVEETKGIVVTYQGELAITPYFSWSDGRTRSMKEVWGVDKPWLQSVPEPQGYTKTTLYGHGVGLSAHGALLLANDYNYTYEQILKYYYTGIDLAANYNNLFN